MIKSKNKQQVSFLEMSWGEQIKFLKENGSYILSQKEKANYRWKGLNIFLNYVIFICVFFTIFFMYLLRLSNLDPWINPSVISLRNSYFITILISMSLTLTLFIIKIFRNGLNYLWGGGWLFLFISFLGWLLNFQEIINSIILWSSLLIIISSFIYFYYNEKHSDKVFAYSHFDKVSGLVNKIKIFKKENKFNDKEAYRILDCYYWVNDNTLLAILTEEAVKLYSKRKFPDTNLNPETLDFDTEDYYDKILKENFENYDFKSKLEKNVDLIDLKSLSIPVENILYYQIQGGIQKVSRVSGGQSSIGGAIIGGMLAGDTGAIIGSRTKIDTEVSNEDDRRIFLYYYSGQKLIKLSLFPNNYLSIGETLLIDRYIEMLDSLIPEKNYDVVQITAKSTKVKPRATSKKR
jgi:hypothetical protein